MAFQGHLQRECSDRAREILMSLVKKSECYPVAGADLIGEEKRAAHKDRDDEARNEAAGDNGFLHVTLLCA